MTWTLTAKKLDRDSSIRIKGFFNMDGNLRFFKKWMEIRSFSYYERKVNKKSDLKGFRYKLKIEGDKRIHPYIKWYLMIEILANDVEEKEIIENGKKVKKDYGRIKYNFDCKLEIDPDKRWETYSFKKLENLFSRPGGISWWKVEMIWWDELYYTMYALKEDFSRYLNLYYVG